MKKLVLLAMLALAGTASADNQWNKSITATANTGGAISENGAYLIGWDTTNSVYRVVKLNGDGSIATSGGSSTVTGNVSITASVPLTATAYIAGSVPLTTTANILSSVPLTTTANIVSSVPLTVTSSIVSNRSSYRSVSVVAYTVLSQTATSVDLTVQAGTIGTCLVCLTSNGGAAAGFKVRFDGAVAPATLTSEGVGHYIAASTTSQCWGPFPAGDSVHLAGVAASSRVIVDVQQAQ